MEFQREVAVAATCFWARACWQRRWNDISDRGAEATRSQDSKAGAVFRESSDVGVMWSQWDTFVVDELPISCRRVSPDAVRKHAAREHIRKKRSTC